MSSLVNDGGLRHDLGYFKVKCMTCNENVVDFFEWKVAMILVEFANTHNTFEIVIFFFKYDQLEFRK